MSAAGLGYRTEQDVGRRPAIVLGWALIELGHELAASARNPQVLIPGREIGQPWLQSHVRLGHDHLEGRGLGQLDREQVHERRGHVLDDHHRGAEIGRQTLQELAQGGRPAGRGGHGQDFDGLDAGRQRSERGGVRRPARAARRRCDRGRGRRRAAERARLDQQVPPKSLRPGRVLGRRLGQAFGGAGLQGAQAGVGADLGQSRSDQHLHVGPKPQQLG